MVCDPEQPLWTKLPEGDDPGIVRICESMLRTFYGEDNLDAPTYAFNECGAWDDPDPEYTPRVTTEDDAWMEDIPEDFMPDTDPLDISEDEDDDIKYV